LGIFFAGRWSTSYTLHRERTHHTPHTTHNTPHTTHHTPHTTHHTPHTTHNTSHTAENRIDPNRDFAYDPASPSTCMQTVAGRHINELFRSHIFQIGATYHGGMTAIAYEWGSPGRNVDRRPSPDDEAQHEIALGMSNVGGTFSGEVKYPIGTMNDVVYYVHGGMEDWGYAGSWDTEFSVSPKEGVGGCTPKTYGGYPKSKTFYNDAVLRCFNILVETSRIKKPPRQQLGSSEDIFNPQSSHNGHVPRNVRLTLLMMDVAEPYARFSTAMAGDATLNLLLHDLAPRTRHTSSSCESTHRLSLPKSKAATVTFEWEVGGGFNVDETDLYYGLRSHIGNDFSCSTKDIDRTRLSAVTQQTQTIEDGKTRWSNSNSMEWSHDSRPTFSQTLDLSGYNVGDVVVVIARAVVDKKAWNQQPGNPIPDLPPQSHLVNARSNENWFFQSGGKFVRGRVDWFSVPVSVVIVDDGDGQGATEFKSASTFETRTLFDNNDCSGDDCYNTDTEGNDNNYGNGDDDDLGDKSIFKSEDKGMTWLVIIGGGVGVLGLYCVFKARKSSDREAVGRIELPAARTKYSKVPPDDEL